MYICIYLWYGHAYICEYIYICTYDCSHIYMFLGVSQITKSSNPCVSWFQSSHFRNSSTVRRMPSLHGDWGGRAGRHGTKCVHQSGGYMEIRNESSERFRHVWTQMTWTYVWNMFGISIWKCFGTWQMGRSVFQYHDFIKWDNPFTSNHTSPNIRQEHLWGKWCPLIKLFSCRVCMRLKAVVIFSSANLPKHQDFPPPLGNGTLQEIIMGLHQLND